MRIVNKDIQLVVRTGQDIFRNEAEGGGKSPHKRTFMPFMYATVVYM